MTINLDNIPNVEIICKPGQPTPKLFIDCGTHTFKAGFLLDNNADSDKQQNKKRRTQKIHMAEPNIVFRNKMYKYKQNYTLVSDPQTSFRTLFEKDVIINVEVLEATLDIAFDYLYKNKKKYKIEEIIFVTVIDIPKMFLQGILQLFFDVYEVEKVTIGVDAYYSYLWNVHQSKTKDIIIDDKSKKSDDLYNNHNCKERQTYDLIISFSHSNTIVYLVTSQKIVKYYKLPYGSALASEYLQQLINSKYNEYNYKMTTKEAEYLMQHLRVSLDYKKETFEIFENQKKSEYKRLITSKNIQQLQQSLLEKPKKLNQFSKEKVANKEDAIIIEEKIESKLCKEEEIDQVKQEDSVSDDFEEEKSEQSNLYDEEQYIDEEDCNVENGDINEEEKNKNNNKIELTVEKLLETPDSELTHEQIKEKRRQKMIFFSSIYRYKQKIEKELKKLKFNIDHMEEYLEKTENIDKYINKIKERYVKVQKDLKTRERIKRNLRNKKSQEYDILTQFNNGHKFNKIDEETLRLIEETEDEEIGNILLCEYQKYYEILNTYCSDFLNEVSTISVIKNSLFNFNADIEILRVTEVFFEPSLCGITQPGLREIFEDFKNETINNVLLTGGFSKIEQMKERITNELTDILLYKEITVINAEDPVYDLFYGAQNTDAFKVYEKENYYENQ